jgi:hypothetical protein
MDGKFYYVFRNTLLTTIHFLAATMLNLPIIPESAYAAALKEYEDMDETDSEGDGLSW